MNYLPLQYCIDIQSEANEFGTNDLEEFFRAFSNRDFGTYNYSFSSRLFAQYSKQIVLAAQKPRKAESVLQPLEVPLILELWKRTKQVYEPEPIFSEVLRETESIKVYPELLRRIPMKDFYIDFTKNDFFNAEGVFVSVRVYDNDEIRILYMVTDNKKRNKIVDIIDFTPEEHPMENLEKEVKLPKVQRQIVDMDRAIIHARGGILKDKRICTGENYISRPNKASYYAFEKSMCPNVYQGHNYCYFEIEKFTPEDTIADITIFIIQFLLYLSSKEPNITESELTKKTYKPYNVPKNKFSQVRKWDVELYYGEKLKLLEDKERTKYEYKEGTHKSPRPHTRCAHWQGYWCGSGDEKHLELRWKDFTYVNGKQKDIIVKKNETEL